MRLAARINGDSLRLDRTIRVLKAGDYQQFVAAQHVIGDARRLAAHIEESARAAWRSACKKGRSDGLAMAQRRAARQDIDAIQHGIAWLRDMETAIADTVVQSLQRVAGKLDIDRLTLGIVEKVLRDYRNLSDIRLRVAPGQAEKITGAMDRLCRETGQFQFIRVEADSRLNPGDCLMESPLGTVNAGLDHQIRILTRAARAAVPLAPSADSAPTARHAA